MLELMQLYESIKRWIEFRRIKITVVVFVSAVFSVLILHHSFTSGRLSACPKYDDVTYLLCGALRLKEYSAEGLIGLIKGWVSHAPHSPYAEGVSFLGFLLFGIEDWAPYVLNTGFCFLFLWMVLSCFGRINWLAAIAICVAACTIPMVGGGINEIRPDFMCSLLVAGGVLRTATGNFLKRSRRYQCITSLLFGFALLAKPSVFPSTIILQALCLALAIASLMLMEKIDLGKKVPGVLLRFFGPSLALASLYYISGFSHVTSYIYRVLFSTQKEAWMLGAQYTKLDHLLFYLIGFGAQTMLGIFAVAAYVVLAAGLAAVSGLRKKQWWIRYLALVAPLVPMYLIITVTKTKTPYFGLTYFTYLTFVTFFILGKFLTWGTIYGAHARQAVLAVLIGLCLAGALSFKYPATCNHPDPQVRKREDWIVLQMANAFEYARPKAPVVAFHTIGSVGPEVLSYTMLKHGVRIHTAFDGFTTDLAEVRKTTSHNDYVVISEPGTPLVAEFFPAIKLREPLIAALKVDSDYVDLANLNMPPGKYIVFEHLKPFCGFKPVSGIAESKMPPQSSQAPADVFVTSGPAAELAVYAIESNKWKIVADLKASENMQLTFNLDGKTIGNVLVHKDFFEHTIEFDLEPGLHKISILASDGKDNAGITTFKRLQIVPAIRSFH